MARISAIETQERDRARVNVHLDGQYAFSVAGIFFLINTFLATYSHDWPWAYWMPIGILGVCLLARTGRSLGVDAYLLKRFGEPKFLLW